MKSRLARGLVGVVLASAPACLAFDELTGGASDDAGASDATATDAATSDVGADSAWVVDAASDASTPFCSGVDATFCDSFDRDAAIAVGAPWKGTSTRPGCTLTIDGQFTSTFDASTGAQNCYLVSNLTTSSNRKFQLDFDSSYVTDGPSNTYILVAQLVVAISGVSDAGLQTETFQLLVNGVGSSRVGVSDYFPDGAASPIPPNQYLPYTLGNATPFTHGSPPCHITWNVDSTIPSASATSTCDNVTIDTTPQTSGAKAPPGFASTATLQLGFANPSVTAPAWSITYDNMVFRASP